MPSRNSRRRFPARCGRRWWLVTLTPLALLSCEGSADLPPPELVASLASSRFETTPAMRASLEMQLSGEPFATALGYNLCGFNRRLVLTDQYASNCGSTYVTDPLGYALAVESFEYAKQPMNNLSLESGAGLSLMYGPVLNPAGETGELAETLFANRFQQLAAEANASGPVKSNLIVAPAPELNVLNYYGWPGLWPAFAEFASFDPGIDPVPGQVNNCTFTGSLGSFGYGPAPTGAFVIANYECDYNSLNLPNRNVQVDKTLTPDALGYATWKEGLAIVNYWHTLQDTAGNRITSVSAADLPQVGQPGNVVVGTYPDPTDPNAVRTLGGAPGVYLGDDAMEGWQGLTIQDEVHNKAALILDSLLTSDGATLTGAPSVLAAIDYSYDSPLLWFPAAVSVVETPTTEYALQDDLYFPQPTAFTIADGSSQLVGLSGLIGGFAEVFSWTDPQNPSVGGSVPFLATYDGDPFPQDDGLADGQATLHDRALGILKIGIVDLDRLHLDPVNGVLVDAASFQNGMVTRGSEVTTVELAEAIIALRNAAQALSSRLAPFSVDATPDLLGLPGQLDDSPLTGAPFTEPLEQHLATLIEDEATFLSTRLVAADGSAANGYDLQAQAADPSPTLLEAQLAALRGLLDAYLATSEEAYREQAMVVYANLQSRFWLSDVRCFETTFGSDAAFQFTPLRFSLLTGALRQYYLLVDANPERSVEGTQLLAELKRMYKLILNGWDDRNQDNVIQYPSECLSSRLEMGERALTQELGHPSDHGDRDSDCVMELSYVDLPAALGAELDLARP